MTSVRHCVELRLSHERTVKLWSADPDFTVRAPFRATTAVVIFQGTGSTAQSVHCDLVNEFLSSESSGSFRLPDKISCCALQWNNVEVPWFRSVSGPNVLLWAPSLVCLGPNATVSYRQICIVVLIHTSELDSVFFPTPICLATSLVVYSLSLFSRSTQVQCSRTAQFVVCPDSKQTVQRQKTFRIRIFESKCSQVFRCVP